MNKIALAAGLSLLGTATSFAADMAVKAPVAPLPPPCIWCGAYVGLNAGYAWADPSVDSSGAVVTNTGPGGFFLGVAPAAATGLNASIPTHRDGFIGGGQIGYNWQAGNFVAGVEADLQWLSGRGSGTVVTSVPIPTFPGNFINATLTATNSVDWLGTLRGRAGFTLAPTFLVYATGGLAYGEAKSSTTINQALVGPATTGANAPYASVANFSETRVGWTAGAGGEWMFAGNWSAKLEYLHYDLGSVSYGANLSNLATPAAPVPAGTVLYTLRATSSTNFKGDIVRVGINYKFGAAPARY